MGVLKSFSLVLLLGLMAYAPQAYAVPTLRFTDSSTATVITVADGGGGDANALPGVVTFVGAVGVFDLNVTTGTTKPFFPDPPAHLDLAYLDARSAGLAASTLTIEFSDIGFSLPGLGFIGDLGGTFGGAGAVSVKGDAYFDNGNTLFAQGTLIGTTGVLTGSPYAVSFSGPGAGVAPYSLTQVLTLVTSGGPANFSGDFELTQVPEPASVALLGGVLLLTFGALRRKVRQN